jgi:hypothetical protein
MHGTENLQKKSKCNMYWELANMAATPTISFPTHILFQGFSYKVIISLPLPPHYQLVENRSDTNEAETIIIIIRDLGLV